MNPIKLFALFALFLIISRPVLAGDCEASGYDLVITNGRVMNPANGLDSVRNLGLCDGRIAALSREPLQGRETLDADGLVVAPGFIDLHAHGQREFEAWLQARDGVTTQLEMELGVFPVASWYRQRAGNTPINYGATVGHILSRIATFIDLGAIDMTEDDLAVLLANGGFGRIAADRSWMEAAASEEQIAAIQARMQQGLDEGALGAGFGINYTAGATREEIFRLFELVAENNTTAFVHSRFMAQKELGGSIDAIQELLAVAASTGAGLHIVHIGSSAGRQVPLALQMIDGARRNGVDVTTEVYPYTAWSTFIGASIFNGDFTQNLLMSYDDIELPETGERLNEERFYELRASAPGTIIVGHSMRDEDVLAAVAHPGVMIASDGMFYQDGRAHPRGAGTFSRVLGHYVRERETLGLMDALGKMSYLPAKRLENVVPQMKRKGRIEEGADADLILFDPATVTDNASFAEPAEPSTGIEHVLVNGVFVVRDGEARAGVYPGQAIRRQGPEADPGN